MSTTLERAKTDGAKSKIPYSPPTPPPRRPRRTSDNSGYWAAFSLLLGMLVVVLGFVAVWMGLSAHDARNDAKKAATSAGSMPGMDMSNMSAGRLGAASWSATPAKRRRMPTLSRRSTSQ